MSGPTRKTEAPSVRPETIDPRSASTPSGPGLDRMVQAHIGDRLRSLYGELVEQPVPDRLIAILDQASKR